LRGQPDQQPKVVSRHLAPLGSLFSEENVSGLADLQAQISSAAALRIEEFLQATVRRADLLRVCARRKPQHLERLFAGHAQMPVALPLPRWARETGVASLIVELRAGLREVEPAHRNRLPDPLRIRRARG